MERLPASIAAVAAGVAAAVWYAKRRCTTRAHAITSDTYGIASKDEPSKDEPSERIVGVQPSVDEAVPLWQTTNAAGTFSLVDALIDSDDAFLDVVRLMPAVSAARLAKTSHAAHAFILQPHVANWAAESRRHLLQRRNVPGDLPLLTDGDWTLERLHLCEHPPRFPKLYFRFGTDALDEDYHADRMSVGDAIAKVAALLQQHPRLRLRIHGYAQPDAPSAIGEALAQGRAVTVRKAVIEHLRAHRAAASPRRQRQAALAEFAEEDADEGVRANAHMPPWTAEVAARMTRLVGDKIEAVGRWGSMPANRNFERDSPRERSTVPRSGGSSSGGAVTDELLLLNEEVDLRLGDDDRMRSVPPRSSGGDEEEGESDGAPDDVSEGTDEAVEEDGDDIDFLFDIHSRLRCAEFTLLRLDDGGS